MKKFAPEKENVSLLSWPRIFRYIWYQIGPDKKKFVFWMTCILLVYSYELVPPILFAKIIDFFAVYTPGDTLNPILGVIVLLGLLHIVVSIIRLNAKYRMGVINSETVYRMNLESFDRLLELPLKWHESEMAGNKVKKVNNASEAVYELMRLIYNSEGITVAVVSLLGVVLVSLFINYHIGIFFGFYILLFLLTERYYYYRNYQLNIEYSKADENASGRMIEGTSNILTVRVNAGKDLMNSAIRDSESWVKEQRIALINLGIGKWKVFQIINGFSYICFFLILGYGIKYQLISVGAIALFYAYFEKIREGISRVSDVINDVIDKRTKVDRLFQTLDLKEDFHDTQTFPIGWEELRLDNVSYIYDASRESGLISASLLFKRGEKVGIVGTSGGGKSTLAKILAGIYPPQNGKYSIDGLLVRDINRSERAKRISFVVQDTELFNLSLEENITLGNSVSTGLFADVLRVAQLNELVGKLPDKLKTIVGEKGYKLSGGERQRVGIARALIKKPEILILDEATSQLDLETEKSFLTQLLDFMGTRGTIFFVAHRIHSLNFTDRILVVEGGVILRETNYGELALKTKV